MSFPKVEHASDYYTDKAATGWVVHDNWGSIIGHYTTRHDALNAALCKAEVLYNALTHALDSYESALKAWANGA